MSAIHFICPNTKLKVHHWLPNDLKASDDDYETVVCPSCERIHFVNRKGKVFSSLYPTGRGK